MSNRNYDRRYSSTRSRKSRRRKKKLAAIRNFTVIAVVTVVGLFVLMSCNGKDDNKKNTKKVTETTSEQVTETTEEEKKAKRPEVSENYQDLSMDASLVSNNVAVIDATNHKLIAGKNPDARIYPASMTKVMTLIVAVENLQDLNQTYTFNAQELDDLFRQQASVAGFLADETVNAKDLLYGLVLPSGADGAIGIAKVVAGSEQGLVDLMNKKCEEMGLKDTHFMNTSGLHDPNHYTTAVEMGMIMDYAMQNETCAEILSAVDYTTAPTPQHPEGIKSYGTMFKRIYGNEVPGVQIKAGKTGYTIEASHTLASYATSGSKNYIAVTAATTGSYWNSIYDDFKLYSRFCEGYTGEGVTLRSGEVIVPKGDPSQIAQIAETSPETTDENVAAQ